ncbi:MAG: hypothetical protein QXN37_01615 [Candidatus Anstonellaceae archaeon]
MGLGAAGISAAAIYTAAVQKDFQNIEHILKTVARLVIFTLPVAVALAPFFKALNWIGNTLDVLQHVLMDSISRKLNSPEARKHYSNFCTESIRELMVDVLLGTIPIPLIDLLRRFRAIKLELRQLGHINRLESFILRHRQKKLKASRSKEARRCSIQNSFVSKLAKEIPFPSSLHNSISQVCSIV